MKRRVTRRSTPLRAQPFILLMTASVRLRAGLTRDVRSMEPATAKAFYAWSKAIASAQAECRERL